jgi:hypothetical protein
MKPVKTGQADSHQKTPGSGNKSEPKVVATAGSDQNKLGFIDRGVGPEQAWFHQWVSLVWRPDFAP